MPILDVAAQNRSLDNDYGTTAGANAPSGHELALFDADPSIGGVELDGTDCPGYVRVPVAPTDWAAAAGGAKTTAALVEFPDATGAWSTQARWWGLFDGDDHTTLWDYASLTSALIVSAAGPGPAIQPTVFYSNLLDD